MSAHSSETPGRWVTQQEAAVVLGISTEAVRMRVRRGSLDSQKDEHGRVVVWVAADRTESAQETAQQPGGVEELVEELRGQVTYLREQLEQANTRDRENRRLLAAALERIPELEAAQESPPDQKPHEAREDHAHGDATHPEGEGTRPTLGERMRRWWRS